MAIEATHEEGVFGLLGKVEFNEGTVAATESRLSSLKEVALALLDAVDSLQSQSKDAQPAIKLYDEVRRFETELIRTALARTGGDQARAAKLLGVKHTTLSAKIKRYGLTITPQQSVPLRKLSFTGMWSDRADIDDGVSYVDRLRADRRS